ncbi:MAG: zf-HC2 domain-containing protein [Methylophilaceae bacterium]|nr:zf-HC2 domain-containing protein [Methylophilaceae bacterium]
MLNCKEASQLASISIDRKLSLRERLSLKVHLLLCANCTNFYGQISLLRMAARAFLTNRKSGGHDCEDPECEKFCLSDEARQRIHQALENARMQQESLSTTESLKHE